MHGSSSGSRITNHSHLALVSGLCPPISILLFWLTARSHIPSESLSPLSPDIDIRQMSPLQSPVSGINNKYTLGSVCSINNPAHSHQSGTTVEFCNVMLDHQYLIFCQNVLNIPAPILVPACTSMATQTQAGPGSQSGMITMMTMITAVAHLRWGLATHKTNITPLYCWFSSRILVDPIFPGVCSQFVCL